MSHVVQQHSSTSTRGTYRTTNRQTQTLRPPFSLAFFCRSPATYRPCMQRACGRAFPSHVLVSGVLRRRSPRHASPSTFWRSHRRSRWIPSRKTSGHGHLEKIRVGNHGHHHHHHPTYPHYSLSTNCSNCSNSSSSLSTRTKECVCVCVSACVGFHFLKTRPTIRIKGLSVWMRTGDKAHSSLFNRYCISNYHPSVPSHASIHDATDPCHFRLIPPNPRAPWNSR